MAQNRRAIKCIRLQHIHYGINGIVRFKNDACVREHVFSYVFFISRPGPSNLSNSIPYLHSLHHQPHRDCYSASTSPQRTDDCYTAVNSTRHVAYTCPVDSRPQRTGSYVNNSRRRMTRDIRWAGPRGRSDIQAVGTLRGRRACSSFHRRSMSIRR